MEYRIKTCLILCLILLFLSGCKNQSEQNYKLYMSDPDNMLQNDQITEAPVIEEQEEIDETAGELTIYAPYYPSSSYDWIIRAFNKKYPNIKVLLTGQTVAYPSFKDFTEKTSVDLMSGTAGDIVDLRVLPYVQYGKNNLLEDLNTYIDNDQEFHKDDYYTNILEAIEYKDKLYGMPMSFYYFCARLNKTLLEENQAIAPEGDSISFKEISDIYDKIAANNDKLMLSHYWNTSILEYIESSTYFDIRNDKADFNSQGYIADLNEVKRMRWPTPEEMKIVRQRFSLRDMDLTASENDLCIFFSSLYQDKRNAAIFYDKPNLTLPIPISATNGDKEFQENDGLFGITSFSKNKDLAWKFIRFCVEEKPVEFLTNSNECLLGGMPINRNNTLKMLKAAFGEGKEEAVQMVDRWNSERNEENVYATTGVLIDAIYEIRGEFNEGRITAEECAKEIQERVGIYLKE